MTPDLTAAESFLARFVLPLVQGGELHVGAPLGVRGAQRLLDAAHAGLDGTPAGERLQALRLRRLQPLTPAPAPVLLEDRSALFLLVALHDLLFAVRPEAEALGERALPVWRSALGLIGRARDVLCGQKLRQLDAPPRQSASVPPAHDLRERQALPRLLARHSLLAGVWTLQRADVHRSSRWGQAELRGALPAQGTGLWARLSKVEEAVTMTACLPELLAHPHGGTAARALLTASPLTALLEPPAPEDDDTGARFLLPLLDWLRFPQVARLLARHYLAWDGAALGRALGPVAAAGLCEPAACAQLGTLLRLFCHIHLLRAVAELPPPPSPGLLTPAAIDFYALLPVLRAAWPALAAPPDLTRDPALDARAAAYADACRALAGPERLAALTARCALALGPTPPKPAPALALV